MLEFVQDIMLAFITAGFFVSDYLTISLHCSFSRFINWSSSILQPVCLNDTLEKQPEHLKFKFIDDVNIQTFVTTLASPNILRLVMRLILVQILPWFLL